MALKIKISLLIMNTLFLVIPLVSGYSVSAQDNSICGWLENISDTGALAPTLTLWNTNEHIEFWTELPTNLILPGYYRFFDAVLEKPESRSYRVVTKFSRLEKVSSCQTTSPTPTPTKTATDQCPLKSPTGFCWPTGRAASTNDNNYLANGCGENQSYNSGKIHIGADIFAEFGWPVYAVADGVVYDISFDGWDLESANPKKNSAVLIKHTLNDGTSFIAIYGHLLKESLKVSETGANQIVKAGQIIGRIGDWGDEDHLHFGIFIGSEIKNSNHLGRWPCTSEGTNGTVDPIDWLDYQFPQNISEAAIKPESLDYARVGSYPPSSWMLTYDKNLWSTEENKEIEKMPPFLLKMNDNQGCVIRQHIPKKFLDSWIQSIYPNNIGDYIFDVYEFTEQSSGKIQTVLFISNTTGSGKVNDVFIEITPGQDHSRCFSAALRVLELSVNNNFGPIKK
ncbi:MAG: M23 family metallopeptidase [Chloroflexi bacterium]|nr:M23 family metallopeptidase [Chloroflexota bacterium]